MDSFLMYGPFIVCLSFTYVIMLCAIDIQLKSFWLSFVILNFLIMFVYWSICSGYALHYRQPFKFIFFQGL